MQDISIQQCANVLPYVSQPCKERGFCLNQYPKPHHAICAWVSPSVREPTCVLYDGQAPKPNQGVGVVPGNEVLQWVVPVDDGIPVDEEVTVDGQAQVL
jgi:hypothetical protein